MGQEQYSIFFTILFKQVRLNQSLVSAGVL